jgi:outer membrane protein assembly factor BamA
MSFEANIEYRFPLYSFLNGAFFIDAGNVWLIKPNTEFEGGTFKFNNALNEIAIGTGLGVRFDFSFFIVRFDAGIPVKDPAQPENRRWMIKDFSIDRIVGNIGIGYPF